MDADGNRVDITKENPYTMRPGEDRQVLGHKNPDWTLGFKNTFTYKNFDLSFFIYARWGQMMNYEQMIGIYDPTGVRYTFPTYFSYYDKTIQADQNVLFPAADASMTNFGDYDNSGDMNYVDGSFWKIKNLTLGYTLPKNWCNKIGISNLRVYGTVTQPLRLLAKRLREGLRPRNGRKPELPLVQRIGIWCKLNLLNEQ